VSFQVVARYIFNYSLPWGEELSRYFLIWIAWIGACLAVKKNSHLRVELIKSYLKPLSQKYLELIVLAIWFLLPLMFIVVGTKLVMMIHATGQMGQTFNVPMWILYLIIPICGLLMCFRLIQQSFYVYKSLKTIEE